jgi:hypothetical protein
MPRTAQCEENRSYEAANLQRPTEVVSDLNWKKHFFARFCGRDSDLSADYSHGNPSEKENTGANLELQWGNQCFHFHIRMLMLKK